MPLAIEVQLDGIEGLPKRRVNNVLKRANISTGKHFRRNFLKHRFTQQGGRRLNFTPRSGELRVGLPKAKSPNSYAGRKLRKLGHSDPLVFSGEGKRIALNGPQIVHATKDTIRIPLPRKYNFRNPNSRVNMSDEIRRVSNREAVALSKFLAAQIDREFARELGSGQVRVQNASISNL